MIRLVIQLFQKLTSKSWDDIFHSWRWIMGYTRRYWVQVAIYTLITVSGTVLSLITSIVSKNLIDAVTGYNSGSIGWAAAAYAGLGFSNIFINMISGKISLLITTKVSQELREEIFTKLIYTDWESISKYTSGELMVRLGGDTGNIANSILTFLPVAIRSLINFGGAFIIICQHDPWMALIALLGAPVTFLTSRYRMEKMTAFQKENQKMQGRSMTFHQETIRNLQSIKAFGVLEYFVDGLRSLQKDMLDLSLRQYRYQAWTGALMSCVSLAVSYGCYGFAVYRLWQGDISYGTMTLFVSLAGSLSGSFQSVISLIPTMIRTSTSAERLLEILQLDREDSEPSKTVQAIQQRAKTEGVKLSMEHVSFHYADGRQVYEDVEMKGEAGEIVGLIGPSGKGKTTCLRMLLGLVRPQEGQVLVGQPGDMVPVSAQTRCLFSYVPQNNTMFYGTIAENLRIVKPTATDQELEAALKDSCAWEFVSELKDGIYADIGEQGYGFSEGQKQRLAIARAFLADTPVLLLDEATSALDTDTEQSILSRLRQKNETKLLIVTAHRPSVYQICDRIYRIEKKKITVVEAENMH